MKRRLPWVLLAISMALNVFFIAGALYTRDVATTLRTDPEARITLLADGLSLTTDQVDDLKALRSRLRERRSAMRPRFDELRGRLLDVMAKDTFDRTAVLEAFETSREVRQGFIAGVAEELHAYLATLSPEQKSTFLAMARQERWFLRKLVRDRGED